MNGHHEPTAHAGPSHQAEGATLRVILLTCVTMVAEIVAGTLTHSMALLADGWHMGTHAFALAITYFAFRLARRHAASTAYTFGTGKFGILGGYTSAIFLGATALFMIVESVKRLVNPVSIAFNEAIVVSVVGLAVNGFSVWILHERNHDSHDHDHGHHEGHGHRHDHNLRAAYFHVLADALTSILAIVALLAGKFLGLARLDPVMGIVGGILICKWAWGLLTGTGAILLDRRVEGEPEAQIRDILGREPGNTIRELRVWHVGSNELAVAVSLVAPGDPATYRARLRDAIPRLTHVLVEVHTEAN